jgi:hypothetical protein
MQSSSDGATPPDPRWQYATAMEGALKAASPKLLKLDPPAHEHQCLGSFDGNPDNNSVWLAVADEQSLAKAREPHWLQAARALIEEELFARDYPRSGVHSMKLFVVSQTEVRAVGGWFRFLR